MVYVVSDIHGNMQRWRSIKHQIKLKPEDHLYILGDVIDRYPDGLKILREVMRTPNITMLKGNHEYMMQQYYESDKGKLEGRLWFRNGGYCTSQAYKYCSNVIKQETLDFIAGLPINIDIEVDGKKYLLVHGAPLDAQELFENRYNSPEEFSVWYRIRPYDRLDLDRTVIHGHTPVFNFEDTLPPEIIVRSEKINIDCGCGYDIGRLACLRLDDMAVFYSD